MATGPPQKQKKWAAFNSISKDLCPPKTRIKPCKLRHFSTGENDCSGDSSSFNRNGADISLPGYALFGNKVRISFNTGSKAVIRALKRKLVTELVQIRSLKTRLESAQFHTDDGLSGSSCVNGVGTLARVSSEVSYAGPADRAKKTPKINQHQKSIESGIEKEKVPNSNNSRMKLMRRCGVLLEMLMKHKYGWVFNKPVDAKKLNLLDYHKIIEHPMDLGTVSAKLKRNLYKSPKGFAEDVRLTFVNAKTYNEKGQDAHIMADVLLKLFEEEWAVLKAEYNYNERLEIGVEKCKKKLLKSKEYHAPPLKEHLERKEVMAKTAPVEDKTDLSKQVQKEMTFMEKQILSDQLLNLPSDKLDCVVQIVKKRNPGLFQEEDEIELDIDSVDSETLWELHRLVNEFHLKDSGKAMGEDRVHNLQETNLTSNEVPAQEQDNVNRSCGSGTSRDSDSSSSGH